MEVISVTSNAYLGFIVCVASRILWSQVWIEPRVNDSNVLEFSPHKNQKMSLLRYILTIPTHLLHCL